MKAKKRLKGLKEESKIPERIARACESPVESFLNLNQ